MQGNGNVVSDGGKRSRLGVWRGVRFRVGLGEMAEEWPFSWCCLNLEYL